MATSKRSRTTKRTTKKAPPWKPSTKTTRYDHARVERLASVVTAFQKLRLPSARGRKLLAILSALEVQIEDGGDSPEVNQHLLDALRAGLDYQVSASRTKTALRALDTFAKQEKERWAQVRAGTLPPIELTSEDQLDDLMQEGYKLLERGRRKAAVDKWLMAWERIKEMAGPAMRTADAFDVAYRNLTQSLFNWCSDMELELINAGANDVDYFAHCVRYVDEFLAQFSDESDDRRVGMLRARGEALWRLGRRSEAEAAFEGLCKRYPDKDEVYVGWSDCYRFYSDPKEYERAEAVLLQALARSTLEDYELVESRLAELHKTWDRSNQSAEKGLQAQKPAAKKPAPVAARPRPDDLCWCGSGKQYKYCHMPTDHEGGH